MRTDPTPTADEITTLRGFLDFHRDTLRLKCEGLNATQLATTHPPSALTLGGLLKHLALVESHWLRWVWAERPLHPPFDTAPWDDDEDWELHSARHDSPEELRAIFDACAADSDAIIEQSYAVTGLEGRSARPDRETGDPFNLRWILVHLIEEYARHNGHADIIRESLDGVTGE
ncbi:DinB family protein [Demetria terragena]|uniref:DinB family protein n=1 Tax=Demetria terragena TaxID=63959 RepID=UPI0003775AC3|nr:DinB family protein [Demetria terragena]